MTRSDIIRSVADRIAEHPRGVSLGGYPYDGGLDPYVELHRVAGVDLAGYLWAELRSAGLERGLVTDSVLEIMRRTADQLEREEAAGRF